MNLYIININLSPVPPGRQQGHACTLCRQRQPRVSALAVPGGVREGAGAGAHRVLLAPNRIDPWCEGSTPPSGLSKPFPSSRRRPEVTGGHVTAEHGCVGTPSCLLVRSPASSGLRVAVGSRGRAGCSAQLRPAGCCGSCHRLPVLQKLLSWLARAGCAGRGVHGAL